MAIATMSASANESSSTTMRSALRSGDRDGDRDPPLVEPRPTGPWRCSTTAPGSSMAQPYQAGFVEPGLPAVRKRLPGGLGLLFLGEEAVDRRARAGDVGPECAELLQLVGERRRRKVVRRQGGDVARVESPLERSPSLGEAGLAPRTPRRRWPWTPFAHPPGRTSTTT